MADDLEFKKDVLELRMKKLMKEEVRSLLFSEAYLIGSTWFFLPTSKTGYSSELAGRIIKSYKSFTSKKTLSGRVSFSVNYILVFPHLYDFIASTSWL